MIMRDKPYTVEDLGKLFNTLSKFEEIVQITNEEARDLSVYIQLLVSSIQESYLIETKFLQKIYEGYSEISRDLSDKYASRLTPMIMCIIEILNCDFYKVPLYINYAEPIKTLAQWRLGIAK
jgi:hypothetical protein